MRKNYFECLLLILCVLIISSCTTWKPGKSGQRKLQQKTFVILGASSGFGRGVAEQLGAYKANVVIAARRTAVLQEIAEIINRAGGTALVVTADASNPEDVKRLSQAAIEKFGKVDVWINMAGIATVGKFWEVPPADQVRVIDVNMKGVIYGAYEAIAIFRKQGYGTLINMGSVESEVPVAYQAAYTASKAGVRNLGLALSQELRIDGHKKIKVVTIEPWAADTPFWRHIGNYTGGAPSMIALDPPDKIVNAVLRKSLRPKKEVPVGWKAHTMWGMHRMWPRLTERITGNVANRYQIKFGPPVADTVGAIYQPMQTGTGIDDGAKERTKAHKKIKRNKEQ
ncbi:SDR family NAD(P)-dependent oxidoreductase [Chitinophaga rhizophila]|uniref:SDR family NAD(P)-dependent oxidoreductase n=1 Tax=Chitinophaga rhizophila TaxID=2866212 RepID=A0ABS7G5P4_9BACT|nr:SDR family NAD(P)-dependent oxidoreductase [Chitinophaga rhizophila]MBW8682977.1 SDR family NAD(P)-dependent oxidoreductase [Chitinophaga rhizophila]